MAELKKENMVYRFKYSGNQIRTVIAENKEVKDETFPERNAHWFVVIIGVLACVGWWKLWL